MHVYSLVFGILAALLSCTSCESQPSPSPTPLFKDEFNNPLIWMIDECLLKFPLSEKAQKSFAVSIFPDDEPNASQVVFCIGHGLGMIDANGDIVQEIFPKNIYQDLPDNCRKTALTDKYEKAKHLYICMKDLNKKPIR